MHACLCLSVCVCVSVCVYVCILFAYMLRSAHLCWYPFSFICRLFLSCNTLEEFDPVDEEAANANSTTIPAAALSSASASAASACSAPSPLASSPALPHLQVLGLFGNKLASFQRTLQTAQRVCPNLERLTLAGNPYVDEPSDLEKQVRALLPQLRWLERKPVL
jgi:Leucine-rich repeat (LRR) protein